MSMALSRVSLILAFGAIVGCSSRDAASDAAKGTDTATSGARSLAEGADPTSNDISNYKLDMDKMRRYAAAIKGFSALEPADTAGMSGLNLSASESTAQTIGKLEAHPVARRVLSQADLSARDYVWITAAYLQAAVTQGLLAASPQAKIPEGQNRQNIDFLNANKAELEVMMRDAGMIR